MAISLTARQQDVLRFIIGYRERFGGSPSYRKIARGIGLASKSGALRIAVCLEERGYLTRLPNGRMKPVKNIPIPRGPKGEPMMFCRIGAV